MTATCATRFGLAATISAFLILGASSVAAAFGLGPEEQVQAYGSAIDVPGYSVPSLVPWDADALPDLVVGQGGGTEPEGKVRVYLNTGSVSAPQFASFSYAQSLGSDLVVIGGG